MGEPAVTPAGRRTTPDLSTGIVVLLACCLVVFSFLPWWTLKNLGASLTFTGIGQPLGPEQYASVLGRAAGRPGVTTAIAGIVVLGCAVLQRGRFGGRATRITASATATAATLVCLAFAARPEYASREVLFQLGAPTTDLGPLVFSSDPTGIGACYGLVGAAITAAVLLGVTATILVRGRAKDVAWAVSAGVAVAACVVVGWVSGAVGIHPQ